MTVTNATAAAGSAKLYDMVTAVPEQTLTVYGGLRFPVASSVT